MRKKGFKMYLTSTGLSTVRYLKVKNFHGECSGKKKLEKGEAPISPLPPSLLKGSDRQSEVVELSMQYCAQIL